MQRWHREQARTRREWRAHQRFVHGDLPTGCRCDEEAGRFRKMRALDCGRPRCQVCHFEKVHGIRSHRQRVADLDFREQATGDE
jgi:hypothetical protein